MKKVDFKEMCREYEVKRLFIHARLRMHKSMNQPRKIKEYSQYYNYIEGVINKLNNISPIQYESRIRRIHDFDLEERMNKKHNNFETQLKLFLNK